MTVDRVYLLPSPLITSTHPTIVEFVRQAVGDKSGAWEKTVAIQNWLSANIESTAKEFDWIAANEIARRKRGSDVSSAPRRFHVPFRRNPGPACHRSLL